MFKEVVTTLLENNELLASYVSLGLLDQNHVKPHIQAALN